MDDAERKRRREAFQALAEYQAKGFDYLDSGILENMLEWESDRGLVIILATYIEDALFDRICRELPKGAQNRATLMKGGPLRNFEQRIS